jgi:hypothetical protein
MERMFLIYVGISETFQSFRVFPQRAGNLVVLREAIFL